MDQWNNSYVYNNQYQGSNNWNEQNSQFVNQACYRPDSNQQYVSFNEFLTQMQSSNTASASNYNNAQYESYPNNQYNYQNMPSTSQTQLTNYNYGPTSSNVANNVNSTYQVTNQSQYSPQQDTSQYTNDMVLKSNLTATANEFVPKSSVSKASSSTQNIPEASSSSSANPQEVQPTHGSSSDKNWRERPSSNKKKIEKDKPVANGHYEGNKYFGNNPRNNDSYRNKETNGRYENGNKNNGDNNESGNNSNESTINKHQESSRYNDNSKRSTNRDNFNRKRNTTRDYDNSGQTTSGDYDDSNGSTSRENENSNQIATIDYDNSNASRDYDTSNRNSTRNYDNSYRNSSRDYKNSNRTATRDYDNSKRAANRDYNKSNRNATRDYDTSNQIAGQDSDNRHPNATRDYDNTKRPANRDYDNSYGAANRDFNNKSNRNATRDYDNSNQPTSRDYDSSHRKANRGYDTSNQNASQDSDNTNPNATRDYDNSKRPANRDYDNSNRTASRDYNKSSRNATRDYDTSNQPTSRDYDTNNQNASQDSDNSYPNATRDYDNSNRSDRRNQFKGKSKAKDTDNRTFYNSSMNKDVQDTRNGRGEGSGRTRNWAGSQRIRGIDRTNVDDEDFAKSYVPQKEEKFERERPYNNKPQNMMSPARFKNRNHGDQANKEMTQRERLTEQLDKGTLECLVCCDRVKQIDPVWSCSNCYHVLHLKCIRKWATSSTVEGKWRCPACQNATDSIPTEYRCMCGALRSPEYQRGAGGAHTCGRACRRPRACPHPCTLLCHPGPCPPCQATVTKQCGCGAETRSVLCSTKLPQVCGRVCGRKLACGDHTCAKDCHEGDCDPCDKTITDVCWCPSAARRSAACGAGGGWACGARCGRVAACGAHVCRALCHPPPCQPCAREPAAVLTCPCGKIQIPKDQRKSCTDPIPLCGNICAKPLACGPEGDKHFCKIDCHEGPCPECPDKTLVQCRCGHSSREVPCSELSEMIGNVVCQKKCNKKLSCGRHRCRTSCCAAASHRCTVVCGRSLSCGIHRCEEFCHTGHCAPCPRLSFTELRCTCGQTALLPPVACGARGPACSRPCGAARACGHEPLHACHPGACPPCVVLTAKRCHGGHEERKTIPCSQEDFSCGLPCGKPLPCGKHTCIKTCHKGPCDTSKCTQPCKEKRPGCGHECAAPCHGGASGSTPCPSATPCRRTVRATCPCGRRHAERTCSDNARDLAKIMSALAATKMQEGGSVDLSDVQRPANMLKTLECDECCRAEARSRALALALQIRNPDVSAKLAPRYSDLLRTTALRDPAFAAMVHDRLTDLVQLAKKSKQKTRSHSFPSMNRQKRQFIHEMCEHFGCESVAYDAEPNRNVVATADKEKSWLPALSVSEVVSREAGRRRVPGPVLRPPPAQLAHAARSTGGWAKLTSTNAWAARSQPKPQPEEQKEPKIDYFDNPPEN